MSRPLLALALLSLLHASCSGGGDGPAAPDGKKLYLGMGCASCHSPRGDGGALAPPLDGLDAHWTRETMAEYLADPIGVVERTPRLKELKNRYNMQMPPQTALTQEQRLAIADYALELSAARGE